MDIKTQILYLARGGKEDIFVEKCPEQQHVIDGIRFLYRQYVKKKPGLILNDSNNHNRRIQTVLFISGIQPVLERPILILCCEGDENKWREYFEMWTNMANDITTDTINPFSKKVSVYIGPMHDVTKFHSREWSGVIIDSDYIPKEILKININAKFKIWITGVDVKNDLTTFTQLFNWLYPKEPFDPNMFKYDKRNPNDVLAKAILLDSFMEDIVLRGNYIDNTIVNSTNIPKVTRKNKDATGTKIKRTKRKNRISSSEDDSPTKTSKSNKAVSIDNNNKGNTVKNANISKLNSRPTVDGRATVDEARATIDETRATIDETRAIVDGTRVTIDETRATINDTKAIDGIKATIDSTIDVLSNNIVDSSKIRIEYYDEDQTDDQRDKINEMPEKSLIINSEEDNSMDLLLKYEVDEKCTPEFNVGLGYQNPDSNDSAYDKETQDNFDKVVKFKDIESCSNAITKSNYIHSIVTNEITKNTFNDPIIQNVNKINYEIDLKPNEITKEIKESEDLFSTESMTSLNKISKQNEASKQPELSIQTKLQSEDLFSTESMSALNKIVNHNEKAKDVKVNDNSSSLDSKLKKMEELAMKKFKGSLLDSIF